MPRQFMNYLFVSQISWFTYCIVRDKKQQQPTFSYFFFGTQHLWKIRVVNKMKQHLLVRVKGQDKVAKYEKVPVKSIQH